MGISFVFICVQAIWIKTEKENNNCKYLKIANLKEEEEALKPSSNNMNE